MSSTKSPVLKLGRKYTADPIRFASIIDKNGFVEGIMNTFNHTHLRFKRKVYCIIGDTVQSA